MISDVSWELHSTKAVNIINMQTLRINKISPIGLYTYTYVKLEKRASVFHMINGIT